MDKNEYLVARVGCIKIAVYCRDVENVYSGNYSLVKLFYQGDFFRGLTTINGRIMQVLDLRRRIGMEERLKGQHLTMVSFNTGGKNSIAVVVDEIVGMQRIDDNSIRKNEKHFENRAANIGLLFPTVAMMPSHFGAGDELIHILDSTYLEKTEKVHEDAGELELF